MHLLSFTWTLSVPPVTWTRIIPPPEHGIPFPPPSSGTSLDRLLPTLTSSASSPALYVSHPRSKTVEAEQSNICARPRPLQLPPVSLLVSTAKLLERRVGSLSSCPPHPRTPHPLTLASGPAANSLMKDKSGDQRPSPASQLGLALRAPAAHGVGCGFIGTVGSTFSNV